MINFGIFLLIVLCGARFIYKSFQDAGHKSKHYVYLESKPFKPLKVLPFSNRDMEIYFIFDCFVEERFYNAEEKALYIKDDDLVIKTLDLKELKPSELNSLFFIEKTLKNFNVNNPVKES